MMPSIAKRYAIQWPESSPYGVILSEWTSAALKRIA